MTQAENDIRDEEDEGPHTSRPSVRSRRGGSWVGLLVLGLLLAGVLVVALGANSWKRSLPVGSVRVEGNVLVATQEILRLANVAPRALLVDVDLAAVRKRVVQNPFIRSVSVNRDGPEGITIDVEERIPLALLAVDRLLYIDAEGVVLPVSGTGRLLDLPVITGALPECVPGYRVKEPAVREALDLLLLSRQVGDDLSRRISEINIQGGGELIVYTSELGVPVIFGKGDLPMKLATFDGFWREIVPLRGAQQLQYVDVRFEDQVVVRWRASAARQ
jgi:cell division protein FtsQ